MIQHKTIVNIVDNSGAKTAQCIRVLGGYKKKCAFIGDYILISIKSIKLKLYKLKIENKAIFKALVVQTKFVNLNKTGVILKLNKNAAILIDKQNNPLATRIKAFVIENLKPKFYKLMSISFNFF